MTNLKVVCTSLICLVAPCKCDPEDEAETTKHSNPGARPGWRADVQVIELPNLASYTQARTGLTVPGEGLWGGKVAGWVPPGHQIG